MATAPATAVSRPGFPVERHRVAFSVIPAELAVSATDLCRWSTNGDALVLDGDGRPYELVDLAAARPEDLATATLVIYSRVLAAAYVGLPSAPTP